MHAVNFKQFIPGRATLFCSNAVAKHSDLNEGKEDQGGRRRVEGNAKVNMHYNTYNYKLCTK